MNRADASSAESIALRHRLQRLNEASVHLAEGLDFDRVLQVVADSARELTGARFGAISVVDERGDFEAFVTSGMTDDERRGLYDLPQGSTYFEHLSGLSEPLRVADLGAYFASLGMRDFRPPMELGPALFAPVLSRGEAVGFVYLSKERSQTPFTDDDETTLVMFATQAALAIANARRYRDEKRARADLQTLLDTAPVGVAVLDANLGAITMTNRELLRLNDEVGIIDELTMRVTDDLVIRRADGREESLADQPLGQLLRATEIIRAERIILARSDGSSKAVLVHATPISDDGGDVSSVMVTLQDMTPLEEFDRLRADILGLARDELRSPLLSIKGAAAMLLASRGKLDSAELDHLAHVVDTQADYMRDVISELSDLAQLHTGTLPLNLAPIDLVRLTADTVAGLGDDAGPHVVVDANPHIGLVTADQRQIARVLRSILSDAVRSADLPVRVTVRRDGAHARVSVVHDRPEAAERLVGLLEGRSGDRFGDRGGLVRGPVLGFAISKGIIEAHGGRIWVGSGDGAGTLVSFTLPLTQPPETAVASHETARHDVAARILAVDLDPLTQRYLNDTLTEAGLELAFARDAEQARSICQTSQPDLVLAKLATSEDAGIELLRVMRIDTDAPVIFVTDHGGDGAALRAIEAGAADYLVKPFSPTELVARIRAAVHRSTASERAAPPPFVLGDLAVDYAARTVTVAGRSAGLTETEYRLLCELTANPGRTLSSDQLMRRVWKKPAADPAGPVRSVVKRLRRKLGEDARSPAYIITVPRVGYRIGTNPAAAEPGCGGRA